jgi:hypothetical protein
MLIRSTLIVATAIATLGLGSPAFAGGGDDSNDITTRTGGTLDTRPRRPPVQALKCHKMTGSGADHVTNNAGNGNCAQCRRQWAAGVARSRLLAQCRPEHRKILACIVRVIDYL